jgi:hypothetical protein
MAIDLNYELSRVVADARAHGLKSIDLAALERLLGRHNESMRRDLLRATEWQDI